MDENDLRERWEERAAIMEYDAGLPRAEAERQAADDIDRVAGNLSSHVT